MLNLPDLPQAACVANKANVSFSKTNKPTTNRLHSESDVFTSNSSIFSNRTLFGPVTVVNPTHQTPPNFKTLSQVLSDHNYSPPDAAELDINKPVTTSRSLKDKLRKAMQENAKVCLTQDKKVLRNRKRHTARILECPLGGGGLGGEWDVLSCPLVTPVLSRGTAQLETLLG